MYAWIITEDLLDNEAVTIVGPSTAPEWVDAGVVECRCDGV